MTCLVWLVACRLHARQYFVTGHEKSTSKCSETCSMREGGVLDIWTTSESLRAWLPHRYVTTSRIGLVSPRSHMCRILSA
jgi:hypothetical protein